MIVIGVTALLVGGAIWVLMVLPGRALRGDMGELGTMSQQWRIEQRASDSYDRWRQS